MHMDSKIIFDSCVWIAFFNKDDSQHKKALNVFKKYEWYNIIVPSFVISEVSAVLLYKLWKEKVDIFINIILNTQYVDIVWILEEKLIDLLNSYQISDTKKLSLVDFSLKIMSKNSKLITFDKQLIKEI